MPWPDETQQEAWRAEGWGGRCRLWRRCAGACKTGRPWIGAVLPKDRPKGSFAPIELCPSEAPLRVRQVYRAFVEWLTIGRPERLLPVEDPWAMTAWQVLTAEVDAIALGHEQRRAKR